MTAPGRGFAVWQAADSLILMGSFVVVFRLSATDVPMMVPALLFVAAGAHSVVCLSLYNIRRGLPWDGPPVELPPGEPRTPMNVLRAHYRAGRRERREAPEINVFLRLFRRRFWRQLFPRA